MITRQPASSRIEPMAIGHETARSAPATAKPRGPARCRRGASATETASDATKRTAGQIDVKATGTTADTNKSAEKISHARAKASARAVAESANVRRAGSGRSGALELEGRIGQGER